MSNTPITSAATATLLPLSPCVRMSVGDTSSSAATDRALPELPGRNATTAVPPWCFTGAGSTVVSVGAHSTSRQPLFGFFDFIALDPIESMAYATACWSRAVSV